MKLPPLPSLKDEPQTLWTRVLTITPVVLTVIATLLAGLSSSEMNKAQYYRTLAAQVQSKAGDQWNFFQAKKLRAAAMTNTLDILQATVDIGPIDPAQISMEGNKLLAKIQPTTTTQGAEPDSLIQKLQDDLQALRSAPDKAWHLVKSGTAIQPVRKWQDKAVFAAVNFIYTSESADAIDQAIANVKDQNLEDEINSFNADAKDLDAAMEPANDIADQIESVATTSCQLAGHDKALSTEVRQVMNDFMAARLRFLTARYDAEARENQITAMLYEVKVRLENAHAARHQQRSQRFFFGMLGAQAAVVVSSLSLAVRRRNLMWSLAAGFGLAATSFAAYVYLFV